MRVYKKIALKLKRKLIKAIQENKAEGLLFSGGLDTSILAGIYPRMIAINVSLKDCSSDIRFAKKVTEFLQLKVCYQKIKIEEAIQSIPEVIKILKSFDPAIPNDIVVYFGLKFAKQIGLRSIMTGDGSDEIFAGYDYMQNISRLEDYIYHITKNMYFSSNRLGKFFGIELKQPYLDKELVRFSIENIPVSLKIKRYKRKIMGKWLLRKAFEDILPKEIIWQDKRPLEFGSGMTKLREIISAKVCDEEFKEALKSSHIKFINKEHFFYYKIYKDMVGAIPQPKNKEKKCPACGAGIKRMTFHCRTCGWTKPIK